LNCNKFVYCIPQNVTQPTIHIHIPQNAKHKIMPDKKDRDCWWAFLSGRPELDWNPIKKPKSDSSSNKRHKYRRAYSPESALAEDLEFPQETWCIDDGGDVQLAVRIDPTESLPTPSGSPAPSELPGEAHVQLHNQTPSHDRPVPHVSKPREPTPSLIAYVDHVSEKLLTHIFIFTSIDI
jgi:hypothetical protein